MHCWSGGGATRISQSSKAPATIESKVPKNIFNQMNKSNRTATITNWILAATPPLLTIVGLFAHSHGAKSRHRGMLPIITLSSKHTLIHYSFHGRYSDYASSTIGCRHVSRNTGRLRFFFDYGGTQVLLKESDANNVCIKAKEQIFFKLIFCDNFSEPVLPSCADK